MDENPEQKFQTTTSLTAATKEGTTLWLVISSMAGLQSMRFPQKAEVTIGRDPQCDVVINDDSVSRRHARISKGELRDLESRNGTRVSGHRLEGDETATVDVGSVIEIGSALIVVQSVRPSKTTRRPPSEPGVPAGHPSSPTRVVVIDPLMTRAYALVDVIGPSSLNVIILGETGTGKEVYADALHAASKRASQPFVRLNCATLHGPLLESELFGHEKGAFTGASQAKPGLLEVANGGTVFLDEIGELPLETQAKLLRALEGGEVSRLGSLASKRVDVRYIAATHRDLIAASRLGTFRSDLYFRLNGFSVSLPPLRRRKSEIVPIAESLLRRLAARESVREPIISAEARKLLEAYSWPGNVRELRNVIERAIVLARGGAEIRPEHVLLPEANEQPDAPVSHRRPEVLATLRDRDRVSAALEQAGGNQTLAAKLLGVSRRALINRIIEYQLDRPRKR